VLECLEDALTPLFAGHDTSLQLPEAEGKAPVRLMAN